MLRLPFPLGLFKPLVIFRRTFQRSASQTLISKNKDIKKKNENLATNPKLVALANYLYADPPEPTPITLLDWQVHETIEHAWQVYCKKKETAMNELLKNQYIRMREAMLELEKNYPEKFKVAMEKEGEELYFHRMLKAPTFTPGRTVWPE
ncbi:hypothetical protein HMI54_012070 [Coelomomyces lativittatus]|nr:hypothetical protein HMI54_012070 [Coelomomyces lativittatus]KAJ1507405.1 hypothetical protein HMI56_000112 [Coelomomyces lativittatus]